MRQWGSRGSLGELGNAHVGQGDQSGYLDAQKRAKAASTGKERSCARGDRGIDDDGRCGLAVAKRRYGTWTVAKDVDAFRRRRKAHLTAHRLAARQRETQVLGEAEWVELARCGQHRHGDDSRSQRTQTRLAGLRVWKPSGSDWIIATSASHCACFEGSTSSGGRPGRESGCCAQRHSLPWSQKWSKGTQLRARACIHAAR